LFVSTVEEITKCERKTEEKKLEGGSSLYSDPNKNEEIWAEKSI
jgi:hypothetical protein